MKFTYSWLKDFVDIRLSPEALSEKLTMAGLEVVSLEEKAGDFVFEIEITSNRPDWLSVIGIAREVSAITGSKMKAPLLRIPKLKSDKKNTFPIRIENIKDCPLYTAKIIRNVSVKDSPEWLKKRLEAIGCRTINNVVDATNYILFTYGEPLHAFDLDKIGQDYISVRRAKNNEKITTIDDQERLLSEDILVIADEKKALAIAGIMGGKNTEVGNLTKNILLEAAIFDPVLTRRARRKLGMQTDSSYRFERGIDLVSAQEASWQAANLICQLSSGEIVLANKNCALKLKPKTVSLDCTNLSRILGVKVAPGKVKSILTNLGFKPKAKGKNKFLVNIPQYRPDINLEIDLIEEVARINGFENIPLTLPLAKPSIAVGGKRELVLSLKNMLLGLGLNEAITYSLTDRKLLDDPVLKTIPEPVEILNPLSQDQEILRPTVGLSLGRTVAYNIHQKQNNISIFEIAPRYLKTNKGPKEELMLAFALSGERKLFLQQGMFKEKTSLLQLKGIVEVIFLRLGIHDYRFECSNNLTSILLGQDKAGWMSGLSKDALDKLEVKNQEIFIAELSLDEVFKHLNLRKKFSAWPKYPGIIRDVSFILKEDIRIQDILDALKGAGGLLLEDIQVADYYKGKQIPDGFKGLTLSFLYRSQERTLTDAQVAPINNAICTLLSERFKAKLR